jgi:hypothetical protein
MAVEQVCQEIQNCDLATVGRDKAKNQNKYKNEE